MTCRPDAMTQGRTDGYTLVLERSSPLPSLAVFRGGEAVLSYAWPGEPSRSPGWLAEVRDVLGRAQIPLDAVGCFVCGVGPGSFSGIRACLAAVSGWALPRGLPVYGVASAAALAVAQMAEVVTVVGDARRKRLWCVTYRVEAGTSRVRLVDGRVPTHTAGDFSLIAPEDLPAVASGVVVSPDWERLAPVRAGLQPCAPGTAAVLGDIAYAEPAARRLEPSPIYLHPAV